MNESGQPIALADNEIVLNQWAADDLKAKVGDDVKVTFYEPESTHGRLREHQPPPAFKLRSIVELSKDGRPTPAADPRLTPDMPGVTDQKSISDWDLPFELVEKIRPQDEQYWDEYRTTPKAFISLGDGEAAVCKSLGNDQFAAVAAERGGGRRRCGKISARNRSRRAGDECVAGEAAWAGGLCGDDAVWRVVFGIQLLFDCVGGDAGCDFVFARSRAARERVGDSLGSGH